MKLIPYRPGEEVEEEHEGEDLMVLEEEALTDIILHLHGRGKDKEHGKHFLLAIPTLCRAIKQMGEETLEPESCKVVLLQKMGLMETVALDEKPNRILCYNMPAICSLSPACQPMEPEFCKVILQWKIIVNLAKLGNVELLEIVVLDEEPNRILCYSMAAICSFSYGVVPAADHPEDCLTSPKQNSLWTPTKQQKHMEDLEAMLRSLLASASSLGRLQFLWEHLKSWLQSANAKDRMKSMRSRRALLCFAVSLLPQFEVFQKILSEGQRRSFVQRALAGVLDINMCVSRAALILLYAMLGEAGYLIGDKEEEIPARIMRKLLHEGLQTAAQRAAGPQPAGKLLQHPLPSAAAQGPFCRVYDY
ncbi:hypothetical protein Y1Q_0020491 [Alligator mississippiensis]|uniref:Uncharacterized protein n=1 Tax=Alligator mississippiensis TaxID=8496 RepID=A0A151PFU8_ALLMI|nr:hypothetical protein Y1Q_0020491 [Alligator mississippiensis]